MALGDEMECRWPMAPENRNRTLAKLFDAANDTPQAQVSSRATPVTFEEARAARRRGEQVISLSHFLPRPELLPEKRFLFFPQLAAFAGSQFLQRRVQRLNPQLHLFGHTHFAWDQALEGVRYVQAPLGSPRERLARPRSMRLSGGAGTSSERAVTGYGLEE
ncbi:unnamed protein product [Effrenium voratum]|uniref:Metallophosphoesterase n=1 Tax=Effrenium voratum TaxID=2562239 RepID=A0AA36MXQ9_9DINO|nr:unnamed protein product [Effrenium voratum]